MKHVSRRLLMAGSASVLMGALTPLHAQQVSNNELLKLVKQQAAEISDLKKRLAVVEAHEHDTPQTATTSSPTNVTAQPVATQAQVQAAIAESRASELALMQAQTANGDGGTGGGNASWGKGGEAGPVFSSDDGFFTFKPDGRLLVDFTSTRGSSYDTRNINGSQISQARLGGEGTIGPLG